MPSMMHYRIEQCPSMTAKHDARALLKQCPTYVTYVLTNISSETWELISRWATRAKTARFPTIIDRTDLAKWASAARGQGR